MIVDGKKMKNNGEKIWKRGNVCLIFAPAFERGGERGWRDRRGREAEKRLKKT